jgi:hypothetical protein
LWLTSAITLEKIYKNSPYKLRVNPSAGALYPTEIYVQIRGVGGIIDGIYSNPTPIMRKYVDKNPCFISI